MDLLWLEAAAPAAAPIAAFAAIALAIYGCYLFIATPADTRRRRLQEARQPSMLHSPTKEPVQEGAFLTTWIKPVGGMIIPSKDWEKKALIRNLVRAGYRGPQALPIFLGLKLLSGIAVPILSSMAITTLFSDFALFAPLGLLVLFITSMIGFFLPDSILTRLTERRKLNFIEAFPDALDMLVVCVEAGQGLDAAIDRVAGELRTTYPDLASELHLTNLEMRVGKSREESLNGLAERVNVDQVQALVTLLVQSERFGTSIGAALRGFAEEMRGVRIQKAREHAAKLPARLTFPVMLCIFPALFLVILGPAFITISSSFLSM